MYIRQAPVDSVGEWLVCTNRIMEVCAVLYVCAVLQPQLGKSLAQRDASLPVCAETDIITIFCCIFCYAVQ